MGPDPAASLPPRGRPAAPRGRRSGPSPQTRRRRRDATAAHMAVLHDATPRHDDTREGQLGDMSFRAEAVDVEIIGSKTDQLLEGHSAQTPPGPGGGHAPPPSPRVP